MTLGPIASLLKVYRRPPPHEPVPSSLGEDDLHRRRTTPPHPEKCVNTISVALCTFNGKRFLPQQLASILEQTRLPDEVVICDDGSTDSTVDLVQELADKAPFPVRLNVNPQRLGSTENFIQAIRLCRGEFIALSDQDDIWEPSRLERSAQALQAEPRAGLVFSDATVIDDTGKQVTDSLWAHFRFSRVTRDTLERGNYLPCVQTRFVTGATAMFRANLADRCFPIGQGWIHDEWLAASIPLFADLYPIEEHLIRYRRHTSQQIGPTTQLSLPERLLLNFKMIFVTQLATERHWQEIVSVATRTAAFCERFRDVPLEETGRARLTSYQNFIDLLRFRLALPRARRARVLPILRHRSQYLAYGRIGDFVKDVLIVRP